MNLDNLQPYVSVLLLRANSAGDAAAKQCAADLLTEVKRLLGKKAAVSDVVVGAQYKLSKGLRVSAVTYKQSDNAPWTTDPAFKNVTWHSVVVCRLSRLFAVCCSDSALPRTLRAELRSATNPISQRLLAIPEDELNAAFVKGETQTLWLSGTHRRVPSKADSKVLSGIDLRAALDPLQDQSFFFSAARSKQAIRGTFRSIGVSPIKSSVWAGGSKSWDDFTSKIKELFQLLGGAGNPVHEPLPVLASTETSLQSATDPYDALIVPEDTLDPVNLGNNAIGVGSWDTLRFEALVTNGAGLSAQVTEAQSGVRTLIGRLDIGIAFGANGQIEMDFKPNGNPSDASRMNDLLAFLDAHPDWLKIWYGSGHVIANRRMFRHRFRDVHFNSFTWKDFNGYDIDTEKPAPLSTANIGNQRSLFCWVKNQWGLGSAVFPQNAGWLACNDGSMEIADFIHLDDSVAHPTITLVHVKGADSKSKNRQVSVASFEIVVGQAVKNIRNLDNEILSGVFTKQIDRRIKTAVWRNGSKANRADMLQKLKAVDAKTNRRVIVVQPHLAKTLLEGARKQTNANSLRAKQLDTLLHSAQAACHAVGATLEIVGEDI